MATVTSLRKVVALTGASVKVYVVLASGNMF